MIVADRVARQHQEQADVCLFEQMRRVVGGCLRVDRNGVADRGDRVADQRFRIDFEATLDRAEQITLELLAIIFETRGLLG